MCGIAALFAYSLEAPPLDSSELEAIRDRLRSRGPDGEGIWISDDRRTGLAHTRLAILDTSDAGLQPMWSRDRRHAIVYNGEIYNFREIRAALESRGGFATETDTEVLLRLYRERGEAMVEDLRGMFAFAIVDLEKDELFLARDAYGIKPLYYADDGATIRVASQVKALLAGGRVSRSIDPAGAASFFLTGSVMEPFTIHEAIRALPAGCTMRVTREGASDPRPWTSIRRLFESGDDGRGDSRGTLRDALAESSRYHLVSDVPVGVFLSAGIDSATVAALASENRGNDAPLHAITLAFDEFRGTHDDESAVAARLASRYGLAHEVRFVTADEFRSDLDHFCDAMDQPTIDGVNTWFVAKAAAASGWKVALSGLGGDELFGGYPSFRQIPRLVRAMKVLAAVPGLGAAFRGIASLLGGNRPKLAGLIELGATWPGAWLLRRGLHLPEDLPKILGREVAEEGLRRLAILSRIAATIDGVESSDFARVAVLESSLYMRNQLLRDTDWASMAHGLEVRVPLVDPWLTRRVAPFVTAASFAGKRAIADTPSAPLPPSITDRTKTGFSVPMGHWLDTPNAGNRGLDMREWSRIVFERWAG